MSQLGHVRFAIGTIIKAKSKETFAVVSSTMAERAFDPMTFLSRNSKIRSSSFEILRSDDER